MASLPRGWPSWPTIPQGGHAPTSQSQQCFSSPRAPRQILWLDVSVNHLLCMAVRQSICQLLHDLGGQWQTVRGLTSGGKWHPPASRPLPVPRCPPAPAVAVRCSSKFGSSAAPCRAPPGLMPESSRSFAGHRNSCERKMLGCLGEETEEASGCILA